MSTLEQVSRRCRECAARPICRPGSAFPMAGHLLGVRSGSGSRRRFQYARTAVETRREVTGWLGSKPHLRPGRSRAICPQLAAWRPATRFFGSGSSKRRPMSVTTSSRLRWSCRPGGTSRWICKPRVSRSTTSSWTLSECRTSRTRSDNPLHERRARRRNADGSQLTLRHSGLVGRPWPQDPN